MCHASFDYCLSLSCCVHIIRSGVNQTVNPWYYPLNWGIMLRWVISGKSMEWPIMKSIKASLRIFFLNLIKKSIKSRLDCSSHTCCGWTWYLSTSPTPLSISLFLSIHNTHFTKIHNTYMFITHVSFGSYYCTLQSSCSFSCHILHYFPCSSYFTWFPTSLIQTCWITLIALDHWFILFESPVLPVFIGFVLIVIQFPIPPQSTF